MLSPSIRIEPFFLDSPGGSLYCIYLAPQNTTPKHGYLYLHPFAEEMHKSRRMAALQARALAAQGHAVLQVDLTGCGDSAGDFSDASWEVWRNNARLAYAWLQHKLDAPITLWGLRTGAMLAVDVARDLSPVKSLLLWQPVINGEQYLIQFLRIKIASEMLNDSQTQSGVRTLRAKLESGKNVEVGGYLLTPRMAHDLAQLNLATFIPTHPVQWFEVNMHQNISKNSQAVIDDWRNAGAVVHDRVIPGEPFWSSQSIIECPTLLAASSDVNQQ